MPSACTAGVRRFNSIRELRQQIVPPLLSSPLLSSPLFSLSFPHPPPSSPSPALPPFPPLLLLHLFYLVVVHRLPAPQPTDDTLQPLHLLPFLRLGGSVLVLLDAAGVVQAGDGLAGVVVGRADVHEHESLGVPVQAVLHDLGQLVVPVGNVPRASSCSRR